MGTRKVAAFRAALFFTALAATACLREKPNGLRADSAERQSDKLVITGFAGDEFEGRVLSLSAGKRADGSPYVQFTAASPNSARQTISVEPYKGMLPACSPGECALRAEKLQYPDGAETRLTITRKGNAVVIAAAGSRLRQLPGGFTLGPALPKTGGNAGARQSVPVRLNGKVLERGKSAELVMAEQSSPQRENRGCTFWLHDASIAGPARAGVAEESAPFTADWVLVCDKR